MLGASFVHVDLVVLQQDLGVYGPATNRANTPGQFVEDVVGVAFFGYLFVWDLDG
jgi:hypothetical protein